MFALLACQFAKAQQTDFNRVVQPVEMKAKDFREYLIQLAWVNNPDNQILSKEIDIAKEELKITKKDWLKDLQVTSNLNEANIKPLFNRNASDATTVNSSELVNNGLPIVTTNTTTVTKPNGTTETTVETTSQLVNNGKPTVRSQTSTTTGAGTDNVFFPRYNVGINLNLGTILTQKGKNSIRQREVLITEDRLNQQKLAIRAETLVRYEQLLAAYEIYKTRVQVEQDAKSNYILIGTLYKTDEKTFVDYNEASSTYQTAVEARIKADTEKRVALYRLEEIIGVTWDQVKHSAKQPEF